MATSSTEEEILENGVVGDWRLPDDTFLDTFVLPGPELKRDRLSVVYPLPRDSRIEFFEEKHFYLIDKKHRAPKSVTAIVHSVCRDFDPPTAIAAMKRGSAWKKRQLEFLLPDGTIMSDEQIAERWKQNGRVQSARGTLMHFQIEQHLNGTVVGLPHSPEFIYFLRFEEEFMRARGLVPMRTELSLFHCGLCVAGQADLICRVEGTNKIAILDWKRSKEIKTSNRFQKLKEPMSHLDDCNFFHYAIQLNIYRYILETEYGLEVDGMYLGVFHPSETRPMAVIIPRLEKEVELLVAHEQAAGRAGEPRPGPDAPFMVDDNEGMVMDLKKH
jgi:hypothetical protein